MNIRKVLSTLFITAALLADPVLPSVVRGDLPVLVLPPRPLEVPKSTELDPSTGLHMTGTPQFIEAAKWRLRVTGRVARPLRLSYDELRRMPRLTSRDPLICRGYFEDYAAWAGASLAAVLERAGVQPRARTLEFVSADGYSSVVDLEEVRKGDLFLAYEWEGKALPELHGYPVRVVYPGALGYHWVKWLVEIKVQ